MVRKSTTPLFTWANLVGYFFCIMSVYKAPPLSLEEQIARLKRKGLIYAGI